MAPGSGTAPQSNIRVFIAEDHELSRTGLRYALQAHERFDVIGEAGNGDEAVRLAKQLQPDIVLMDIDMPRLDGISATRMLKEALPAIKVIMLTSSSAQEQVFTAFSAGADAYCLKDIKLERLSQVLEMVSEGGIWLDPPIAKYIMGQLSPPQAPAMPMPTKKEPGFGSDLTEREMETLSLIVGGKSNKEIALAMGVSMNTVKTYVGKIIQKLAVDDRTQAAVKALQSGLVVPQAEAD